MRMQRLLRVAISAAILWLGSGASSTAQIATATLLGKQLQQVSKNRGTLQAAYSNPKYATVTLSMQFVGLTYNDDLNTNFIPAATQRDAGYSPVVDPTTGLPPPGLPGYVVADLTVSRSIGRNVQAFFGVQNLFDKVSFVQTNPSTIGTPRLVNGGVRVRFSGR